MSGKARREYERYELTESAIDPDPIRQFELWLGDAVADENIDEPYAMTLATVDREGRPSARVVLLRGIDNSGFVFYTNYDSAKGRDLAVHPDAALVFHWERHERQVRVTGAVTRVSSAASDAYFAMRPYKSRLGAISSAQSSVISGRDVLDMRMAKLTVEYPETVGVPRPANWGGYCVTPDSIEFWQGRRDRLHDRLRFDRANAGPWTMQRLAP